MGTLDSSHFSIRRVSSNVQLTLRTPARTDSAPYFSTLGRVFDVSVAVRTARAWMKRRVEAGQPALSGMFTRAEVTYAWPRPDGTVGSDREPVALFTGEAVHAYLGHLSDETVEAMLNQLSIELGAALGRSGSMKRSLTRPGFWMLANDVIVRLICRSDHSSRKRRPPRRKKGPEQAGAFPASWGYIRPTQQKLSCSRPCGSPQYSAWCWPPSLRSGSSSTGEPHRRGQALQPRR
jgi:hypothetical protein